MEKVKSGHEEQNSKVEELQEVVNSRISLNGRVLSSFYSFVVGLLLPISFGLTIFAERILTETAKLDKLETDENAKQLALLRNLVGLNEV